MSEDLPLEATHPHLKEFMNLLNVAKTESDRGMVLINTSLLDDLLQRSLESFLVGHPDVTKLTSGFNAPLGSFSARILASFAVGIINELAYQDLNLLRKIRNDFAHKVEMSFTDPGVVSRCNQLTGSAQDYGDVQVDARGRFATAAAALILSLVNRPHYVGLERLTYKEWKA